MKSRAISLSLSVLIVSLGGCENRATQHDADEEVEEAQQAIEEVKEALGEALETKREVATEYKDNLSYKLETEFEKVERRAEQLFNTAEAEDKEEKSEFRR